MASTPETSSFTYRITLEGKFQVKAQNLVQAETIIASLLNQLIIDDPDVRQLYLGISHTELVSD